MSTKKIKVLYITDQYPSRYNPTILSFIEEQINEMSKLVEAVVMCPKEIFLPVNKTNRINRKRDLSFPDMEIKGQTKIFYPKSYRYLPGLNKKLSQYLKILSIFFTIKKFHIDFDLIHSHFAYFAGFLGMGISKLTNKSLVITVHGTDIHTRLPNGSKLEKKNIKKSLEAASKVIAVSNSLKDIVLKKTNIDESKICVISDGLNIDLFKPATNMIHEKILDFKSNQIILFIGNLVPVKGIPYLIEAFKKICQEFPDLRLLIVGDGPEKQKLLAQANGFEDKIKFLGKIIHKEMNSIIPHCDLLCLPSLNEGFGIVLIEAMACGKPVVASLTGGIPDIVTSDDVGFLVQPGDVSGLANAIKKALLKKWDSKKIRERAYEFNWNNVTNKILSVYQEILLSNESNQR